MNILEAFCIKKGYKEMVSLVGGGGKTSTLFRLAKELKAQNLKVLVTTTTAIFYPDKDDYDNIFLGEDYRALIAQGLNPDFGTVTIIGSSVTHEGKLKGITQNCADELYINNIYDVILVEADGAKRKPIKAPNSFEPVIPRLTTIVIGLIGFDSYQKPIGQLWVHRPHLFSRITGRKEGELIDQEVIIKLVLSPEGLFKDCPVTAQKMLFINKVESQKQIRKAQKIGVAILKQNNDINKVLLGSILTSIESVTR